MNARMPELKACFGKLGFTEVRTILSSGNVVFTAAGRPERQLAACIESGLANNLPRGFPVIVRSQDHLLSLLDADPYAAFRISPKEKRVVTFLAQPHRGSLSLPMKMEGARILAVAGNDVFSAYIPGDRGPVFMTFIEKTFGKGVTTRTWGTVGKCAVA